MANSHLSKKNSTVPEHHQSFLTSQGQNQGQG